LVAATLLLGSACANQVTKLPAVPVPVERYDRRLTVGTTTFSVEVVSDAAAETLGLSYRDSLPSESGMYFDFRSEPPQQRSFWMRGMRFPLDLVWIRDGQVVGVTENVPTPRPNVSDDDLPRFTSPTTVDAVLEINSGVALSNGVSAEAKVFLNTPHRY
jgi:uncharacterized membrane protein (UPF0127 family)